MLTRRRYVARLSAIRIVLDVLSMVESGMLAQSSATSSLEHRFLDRRGDDAVDSLLLAAS